jgi:DNA helicase MCM8
MYDLILLGLLLGLFGGNNSPIYASKGPFSKRADIHVLIVGDPGLGKSQMLHACSMVSPRGSLNTYLCFLFLKKFGLFFKCNDTYFYRCFRVW